MVLTTGTTSTSRRFCSLHLHHHSHHHSPPQWRDNSIITFAQKPDQSSDQQKPNSPFNVPFKLLAQSAVAVLGLGFIDAGYSGDWSRIGVISREEEDLLKTAAFVVIPLCLGIIFYLSTETESS
ncbi:hypothetical protein Droror1_Dr00006817 [Drosera rotundifolia]